MKDGKKISINDIVNEAARKNPATKEQAEFGNVVFNFSEDFDKSLLAYNETIQDFAPEYANTQPLHDILIRSFTAPLERTPNGTIIANRAPLQVPTKSGVGEVEIDDPFMFTDKAVVVAIPDGVTKLKVGDIIILGHGALKKQLRGRGEEAISVIKNSFIHPNTSKSYLTPTDPANLTMVTS
jgi:hypothetical protein